MSTIYEPFPIPSSVLPRSGRGEARKVTQANQARRQGILAHNRAVIAWDQLGQVPATRRTVKTCIYLWETAARVSAEAEEANQEIYSRAIEHLRSILKALP